MIFSLVNYLRGYLEIEVIGGFGERFLNLLVRNNIFVWSVKRVSAEIIRMKIRVAGFKRIRSSVRKTRVKIKIIKKCGLSMFLHRHRHRKAFFIGIALFLVILGTLTSFIWSVEITGTEKIDKKVILNELNACGIGVGVLKYNHSSFEIKHIMLTNIPELAWIHVEIRGTRALVEVREKNEKPQVVDADTPCNIIAARDGVIDTTIVRNGVALKGEGDVVKKGELLVSGTADSVPLGTRLLHADGEIFAFTWYEETAEFPLQKTVTEKTGESENRYKISVGGGEFTFFPFIKADFSEFEETRKETNLKLWGDFYLPIILVSSRYDETRTIVMPLAEREAAEYYSGKLFKKMEASFVNDTEIIDKNYIYEIIEGKISIRCTVKCREQIGVMSEILLGG